MIPASGDERMRFGVLTSEPVTDEDSARRVIGLYQKRWVIEEFHRVLKEGCTLERSQLDSAEKIHRLASLKSVVAVRMLQIRDLAEAADPLGESPTPADRPAVLRAAAPWEWIVVVSHLAGVADPLHLTPRLFWRTIAKRGGWIGRKHDGRPGWKSLWRGWHELVIYVEAAQTRLDFTRRK